jgi:8-oxo-dGTP pyrophosphatase MutT (NUDIX family)
MKPFKATGIQYAALPYRMEGRQLQILLVTSRRTRRWIIPKGWPMKGLAPHEAAATEAAEEAGITGDISDRAIGSYRYLKRLKDERSTMAIQVIVFPLQVAGHAPTYKEDGQRSSRWFRCSEAAKQVAEPALQHLIRSFGAERAPNPVARAYRSYSAWRASRSI